ncbi:MAG: polysaccharide biosynthesis/export family protein [Nitrospirota bacterium]
MIKKCTVFFLLFIIILISNCGNKHTIKSPPPIDFAAKEKAERLNEAIMVSVASLPRNEYFVGTEDLLEIEAYNVEELKKTVRVNSQGDIALPLIGIIRVKGMTTSEIESLIAKKLEKYVQETVVNVFVKEYRSQRIIVVGAVNKPHVYAITGQRHLLDVLMTAEGLREDAGNICYVIRPSGEDSEGRKASTIVIDLNELLINGNFSLNIPVFAGDVINVPKGGVIFVDGAVKKPGDFPLKGDKITFMQAIAMAQGVTSVAKTSDIRIFRDNGKGERDIIMVDYYAISKGESPDILLAENDIIIVPESGIKNFFNGFVRSLRGYITFGSIGVGIGM